LTWLKSIQHMFYNIYPQFLSLSYCWEIGHLNQLQPNKIFVLENNHISRTLMTIMFYLQWENNHISRTLMTIMCYLQWENNHISRTLMTIMCYLQWENNHISHTLMTIMCYLQWENKHTSPLWLGMCYLQWEDDECKQISISWL
jgi:hypothetical protein